MVDIFHVCFKLRSMKLHDKWYYTCNTSNMTSDKLHLRYQISNNCRICNIDHVSHGCIPYTCYYPSIKRKCAPRRSVNTRFLKIKSQKIIEQRRKNLLIFLTLNPRSGQTKIHLNIYDKLKISTKNFTTERLVQRRLYKAFSKTVGIWTKKYYWENTEPL